jgi:hypothetical protein
VAVSSAIDAAKNWTSTFSRFGFGVLVLWLFERFGLSFFSGIDGNESAISIAVSAIVWAMLAILLGSAILYVGSSTFGSGYDEESRVRRAYRVGQTQNQMLFDVLRDANSKYELGCGFHGIMILGSVVLVLAVGVGWLSGDGAIGGAAGSNAATGASWIAGLFGGLGAISGQIVSKSATRSYDAIDAVLNSLSPVENTP